MDNIDRHITELWEGAKEETPQKSFAETQAVFAASVSGGGGTSGGFDSIINLNSIIMSSIVIVAASLLWSLWPSAETPIISEVKEVPVVENHEPIKSKQRTVVLTEAIRKSKQEHSSSVDKTPRAKEPIDNKVPINSNDQKKAKYMDEAQRGEQYAPSNSWEHGGSHPTVGASLQDEKEVLFLITNNTEIEELDRIKELARTAGIALDYKTRGNIRWINVTMSLDAENGKTQTSITLDGKFEMTIGWIEDEDGKAIRFSRDEDEEDYRIFTEGDSPLFDRPETPGQPESPRLFDVEIDKIEDILDNVDSISPVPPLIGFRRGEVPVLEEGQKRVLIHLDRNTSQTKIKDFEGQAERAGLELDVNLKANGRSLKVKLKGPDSMMNIHADVDKNDDPIDVNFGWVVDKTGDYVRFLEREEIEQED